MYVRRYCTYVFSSTRHRIWEGVGAPVVGYRLSLCMYMYGVCMYVKDMYVCMLSIIHVHMYIICMYMYMYIHM